VDRAEVQRSYADAEPRPFWLTQPAAPRPGDPLEGDLEADLVVVGAGLTASGITLTRRALAKADRRHGRRGPWLRTLDRFGMGFDS
jgi:hypothetical protein